MVSGCEISPSIRIATPFRLPPSIARGSPEILIAVVPVLVNRTRSRPRFSWTGIEYEDEYEYEDVHDYDYVQGETNAS